MKNFAPKSERVATGAANTAEAQVKQEAVKMRLRQKVGKFINDIPERDELAKRGRAKVRKALGRQTTSEKARDRVKSAMDHAQNVLSDAPAKVKEAKAKATETAKNATKTAANHTVEYFSDDEKGTKRKVVAAGVLGVAAVAGVRSVQKRRRQARTTGNTAPLPRNMNRQPAFSEIYYQDAAGNVQTAVETERQGQGIDFNGANRPRRAIIETGTGRHKQTFLVSDNEIIDKNKIEADSKKYHTTSKGTRTYSDKETMPKAEVGSPLMIDGRPQGNVQKIIALQEELTQTEVQATPNKIAGRTEITTGNPFAELQQLKDERDSYRAKVSTVGSFATGMTTKPPTGETGSFATGMSQPRK